ncbi:hypothetical protein A2870_04050 [Candidatus Curtissbacteria bacterium RIFCSPHIGHO2_01_FULL_41_11]|uniref:OmpR/PhoB-type domain-containing protein n=1 Tax=Candidatus Curtissbacteria bacterium RIFCSPHIGHO2_01_FULL_41_11 TaxID=1797711 RepID=A0A1F5G6H8_9BACT|nr:MAG: hypothetical protein A2870_04050 [Candidatus Curtissbacteria bacterium RIFCSPHIGHO2_01_FULL_41_11]
MQKLILLDNFPKDFREKDVKQIFGYVLTGKFCQLISIPGGGKATLLKLMASNENLRKFHLGPRLTSTRIIYLDLHELPNFEISQVEKFLLLSIDPKVNAETEPLLLTKQLNRLFSKLIAQNINIIFLLDHFDEFQNSLPPSFFQMLKRLRTLNKYKFGVVFGTRRDLKELIDREVLTNFYDFFTDNTLYLKIYDEKAINVMFSQIEQAFSQKLSTEQKEAIIKLTSGHAKLTKVLTEITLREKQAPDLETLPQKPLIKEALFEIWLFLTAKEQNLLKLIAQKKAVEKDEALENLIKFDLVQQFNPLRPQLASTQARSETSNSTIQPASPAKRGEQYSFTIPLFEQFVLDIVPSITQEKISFNQESKEILKGTSVISDLLSPQEFRLLRFLIQNEGKIIGRDEIIEAVWTDVKSQEGISDEAIDQMIFRLRKKIEDEPQAPKHIVTVKGLGVRFQP